MIAEEILCASDKVYGEQSKNSGSVERTYPEDVWLVWTMRTREKESRRTVKNGMTSLGQVEIESKIVVKNGRVWYE